MFLLPAKVPSSKQSESSYESCVEPRIGKDTPPLVEEKNILFPTGPGSFFPLVAVGRREVVFISRRVETTSLASSYLSTIFVNFSAGKAHAELFVRGRESILPPRNCVRKDNGEFEPQTNICSSVLKIQVPNCETQRFPSFKLSSNSNSNLSEFPINRCSGKSPLYILVNSNVTNLYGD